MTPKIDPEAIGPDIQPAFHSCFKKTFFFDLGGKHLLVRIKVHDRYLFGARDKGPDHYGASFSYFRGVRAEKGKGIGDVSRNEFSNLVRV